MHMPAIRQWAVAGLLAVAVLPWTLSGCALFEGRVFGPPSLSSGDLENAEYMSEFVSGGKARLRDGRYREKAAPGSASEVVVTLSDMRAAGDLDGDGRDDAAVILVISSGGSGTFYYLAAVLNREGKAFHEASVYMGDRIRVRGLAVREGRIEIDMTVQGPGDPMVRPTLETSRRYRLKGHRLVAASP